MPFDPDNPPDKVKKLSEKKQRQWVHIFNSCYSKNKDDALCHKQAWGGVKNASEVSIEDRVVARIFLAKLLDDYGGTKALMRILDKPLNTYRKLAVKGEFEELADLFYRKSGNISELLDNSTPEGFKEFLDSRRYKWEVKFFNSQGASGVSWFRRAAYMTRDRIIAIQFNTGLPLTLSNYGAWKKERTRLLRDLSKTDVTIRHELTHLLRDAQTGHISEYTKQRARRPEVNESYAQRGHQEHEIEIDAIINGFDQLKKRFGEKRWNKLTPSRLEELQMVRWPRDTKTLSKWVNRLIREDLLTDGMRREWNL